MLVKGTYFSLCKRWRRCRILVSVSAALLLSGCYLWWPPPGVNNEQYLYHFRRSRSLQHYLNHTVAKTQPSYPCGSNKQSVPLVVLVASAPDHHRQRQVIRNTWGKHFPTYFLMGMKEIDPVTHFLTKTFVEFKRYDDLIIYSFVDHYQNLTLKTALSLQWAVEQCPRAKFFMKIDDDVLVMPWRLQDILSEHQNKSFIGERVEHARVHRSPESKYYLPRWLYYDDVIPEYLSGNTYLINMKHAKEILHTAKRIPMINLEDVFFTYIIAKQTLNLTLTHDRRIKSPTISLFSVDCIYYSMATWHSVDPYRMEETWEMVKHYHELSNEKSSNRFYDLFCPD